MTFLSGYKTYIIAGLLVILGVVHLVTGDTSLQEFLADPNLLVLLGGLGLGSVRAAIAKVQ